MTNIILIDTNRELNYKEREMEKIKMEVLLKSEGYLVKSYKKLINEYYQWCIEYKL